MFGLRVEQQNSVLCDFLLKRNYWAFFFKTLYNIIRTQVLKWLIDCCVTQREQKFSYINDGNEE